MRELRRVIVLFAAAVCLLSGCGAGVRPEGASGQGKQDVTIILKRLNNRPEPASAYPSE